MVFIRPKDAIGGIRVSQTQALCFLIGAATLYNITEEPQSGPLYCHKCEESFKQWDPYTSCQIYPNTTPLVECLPSEPYCLKFWDVVPLHFSGRATPLVQDDACSGTLHKIHSLFQQWPKFTPLLCSYTPCQERKEGIWQTCQILLSSSVADPAPPLPGVKGRILPILLILLMYLFLPGKYWVCAGASPKSATVVRPKIKVKIEIQAFDACKD
ncbi:hypothetical protein FSP39_017593 [Pinctada imbricata]|uniref:Uncharacterized protein n=1 Tax=Pinctada imbricata TaxID=66713 RepID=A0AA88XZK3_PINIB|nr:hypothetical protein FSP39_017593 [Pinctada imbricata]